MSEERQTQVGPGRMVRSVLPDDDILYRAAASRDPRFDGRFVTAVLTTGIYCRPVCPARTPRRENVRFLAHAAAAEAAGFRPCRRCRPEAAPGTGAWGPADGPDAVVTRALRRIDEGGLDGRPVAALAGELHVGERQLRRLFADTVGASPAAVARHARLRRARLLIESSDLPLSRVALDAGYGSVRQFNAAVGRAFGAAPGELRRRSGRGARPAPAHAQLAFRPPLAWPQLMGWLAARAIPGVEAVDATGYARTSAGGTVRLTAAAGTGHVVLTATGHDDLLDTVRRARRLLDLDADPATIDPVLADDPGLAPLVATRPGLRVPGCWDPFELAVRAVLGQQISVAAASRLAGRVVADHGQPLDHPQGTLTHRFPSAAALAEAELPYMPAARADALRGLARAVVGQALPLDPWTDPAQARAALLALPGIGPWTAEYVVMRALRDPDAFPATDLVLRRALADGDHRSQRWRPFRAYAAMHLWAAAGSSTASPAGAEASDGGRRRPRMRHAISSASSATTTGTVAG